MTSALPIAETRSVRDLGFQECERHGDVEGAAGEVERRAFGVTFGLLQQGRHFSRAWTRLKRGNGRVAENHGKTEVVAGRD